MNIAEALLLLALKNDWRKNVFHRGRERNWKRTFGSWRKVKHVGRIKRSGSAIP